jgi:hypothetical protein
MTEQLNIAAVAGASTRVGRLFIVRRFLDEVYLTGMRSLG